MATKIRRSFTDEFKQEAVSLLASSGRPLTQVARELGIQPSMLRHWRDDQQANGTVARPAGSRPSGGTSAEHAEIRRLEKELARVVLSRLAPSRHRVVVAWDQLPQDCPEQGADCGGMRGLHSIRVAWFHCQS